MAAALVERADYLLEANLLDMEAARAAGTPGPLLDRLMLDAGRVAGIASSVLALAREADPIGQVIDGHRLANGIWLEQVRVPLGVVAMIYEARPERDRRRRRAVRQDGERRDPARRLARAAQLRRDDERARRGGRVRRPARGLHPVPRVDRPGGHRHAHVARTG